VTVAAATGIELAVPAEAAARAARACGLRAVRTVAVGCTWHDTAERVLEAEGLVVAEWRGRGMAGWRLERRWEQGPALAQAAAREALEHLPEGVAPDGLVPVGGFIGRLRAGQAGPVSVRLLTGALRVGALSAPASRVRLEGPGDAVATLAGELAAVGAAICAPLAAGLGSVVPAPKAVPVLAEGGSASAALAEICRHLAGLIAALAGPAAAGAGPEPVHQMRVAVRRLRSAIRLFKAVGVGPELAAAAASLRALGEALGAARDWDVFLGGLGRQVAAAFAQDDGVTRLLAAAGRERAAAYAALRGKLADVAFRRLGITLALAAAMRPWEGAEDGPGLRAFAAAALDRRRKRALAPGRHIDGLEPSALHGIRLEAKRLRYAAELFAPLWQRDAAQRYIRRVVAVQERLGRLNDAAVAAALMDRLGAAGRGRAGGIVLGFVAARATVARKDIESCWRKLRKAEPFWS
jgi:CHAD domain-containing protein